MPKLNLNFERDNTQAKWLPYTLLLAGLLTSIGSYLQWSALTGQIAEADITLQEQSNKRNDRKPVLDRTEQQLADQQVLQFRAIHAALMTPWPQLLKALEDSKNDKIQLLEISPDPISKTLRITGQASQLQEVFEYIELLKTKSALSDPQLLDHQMMKQDNAPAVHFEIGAKWIQP